MKRYFLQVARLHTRVISPKSLEAALLQSLLVLWGDLRIVAVGIFLNIPGIAHLLASEAG